MKQGWEIKKLGDVVTFKSGYTPKDYELSGVGDVPYYKVSDMNHELNTKYLHHTSLFLKNGCKSFPKHSIVFPKNGAAIATNKKRILTRESVVDLNTGIICVSNPYTLNYEYLYLFIQNIDFRLYTRRGAVPTLDSAELKSLPIPVPPIAEQEKIVAELDCLSGIIEKKKQQLKELDNLAQSIFYEMFGDPVDNDRGWEVKKLGDVCSLKAGKAIKANELSDVASDNLYPCFGGNGIRGYIEKVSHHNQYPIIGRQGALCGNVVLSTKEFYATEHAVVVQPVVEMNVYWSYYTLMYMNLNRLAQGVAQPGLSVGRVNQENFILPPLALQQDFASKIESIEKQKELIAQSIKETETLFNSRMDYYFN